MEVKAPEAKTAEATVGDKDKSLLNQDDKKPEVKDPAKPEEKKVPDAYAPFKVPEGYTLDEKVAGEAGTIFKELALTQEQSQKLVDFYAAHSLAQAKAIEAGVVEMRETWRNEIKADKDIGPKLNTEVKQSFATMLDGLNNPKLAADFRAAMDLTGAGDHPAFIRMMYALSQRLGSATLVTGNPAPVQRPNTPPPSAAHALYPELA